MADSEAVKIEWSCSKNVTPQSQTTRGVLNDLFSTMWPSYTVDDGYIVTGFKIKNKIYTVQELRNKHASIDDTEAYDSQTGAYSIKSEIQVKRESDVTKFLDKNGLKYLLEKLPESLFFSITKTVEKQKWSSQVTAINGRNFYTQTVTVTKLYVEIPTVMLDSQTIPSTLEEQSYAKINYAATDKSKNQIILYAEQKPENTFKIRIIGAR